MVQEAETSQAEISPSLDPKEGDAIGATPVTPATGQPAQAREVRVKKSTMGGLFYKYFQDRIDSHILAKFSEYAKQLMSMIASNPIIFTILQSLIDKLIKQRLIASSQPHATSAPTAARRSFMLHLLPHLPRLTVWTQSDSPREQKESAVELIHKLFVLDTPFIFSTLPNSAKPSVPALAACSGTVPFICNVVLSFLDRGVPLSFKSQVLDLLPFLFAKELPDDHRHNVPQPLHMSYH
jgi:hypothetical protein